MKKEATVTTSTSTTTVVEELIVEEPVVEKAVVEEAVVVTATKEATVVKEEAATLSSCGAPVDVAPEDKVQMVSKQIQSELSVFKEELLTDLKFAISSEIDTQWNSHIVEIGRVLYE